MNAPLYTAAALPSGRPALNFGGRLFAKLGPTREAELARFEGAPREGMERVAAERERLETELAMDGPTARLIARALRSISAGEPLLIEGEPGTSKTTGARFAAALLGLACVRVNFSGATDVGELLGKFVPSDGGWVYSDGPITDTVKRGGLVLLDELNLAPPAVLDRLFPLLETGGAALVLTENRGEVIEAHPDLRFIATINGATHRDRRPLSAPMRSRFAVAFTEPPGPGGYEAMIRHLTLGRAAREVTLRGSPWRLSRRAELPFGALGRARGWEARVGSLALFVHRLEERARDRTLGRDRREPYAFDRRALRRFLAALDRAAADRVGRGRDLADAFDEAMEDAFLEAVAPGCDREVARDLAASLSLYPLPRGTLEALPRSRRRPPARRGEPEAGAKVRYEGEIWTVEKIEGPLIWLRGRSRQSLRRRDLTYTASAQPGVLEIRS